MSCANAGFTLVELIVTMMVVGILAVAVVPRFSALSGFDEAGYHDKVRATLEFARKLAVSQRRYICVAVASNGLDVTRHLSDPDTLSTTPTSCADTTLRLPAPDTAAGNGIRPRSGSTVTLSGPNLVFSPLGRPSGTANCSTTKFCYTGNGLTTITVEAETGYVH